MSFNGIVQFNDNLNNLMESETFKKADDVKKFNLGYCLLKSKYGFGNLLGKVYKLNNNKQLKELQAELKAKDDRITELEIKDTWVTGLEDRIAELEICNKNLRRCNAETLAYHLDKKNKKEIKTQRSAEDIAYWNKHGM